MTGEDRMAWALQKIFSGVAILAFALGFLGWIVLKGIGLI